MKVKAKQKFIDRVASEKAGKTVVRKVGEEFTVSKERLAEIKKAGDFVEEVVEEKKPKAKAE